MRPSARRPVLAHFQTSSFQLRDLNMLHLSLVHPMPCSWYDIARNFWRENPKPQLLKENSEPLIRRMSSVYYCEIGVTVTMLSSTLSGGLCLSLSLSLSLSRLWERETHATHIDRPFGWLVGVRVGGGPRERYCQSCRIRRHGGDGSKCFFLLCPKMFITKFMT